MNNPKNVMVLLSKPSFYEDNLEGLWKETEEQITENLSVVNVSDKVLQLTYTDTSGENAAEVVNAIADAFLKMDKQQYEEKKAFIKGKIDSLEGETVGEEAKIDKERFIFELESAQLNMKEASFVKPADAEEAEMSNKALSSRDRAVLGVLLGVTLAFSGIIVPELVRKQ
jgi:teichuronic acid biosynthesis protein TuaF